MGIGQVSHFSTFIPLQPFYRWIWAVWFFPFHGVLSFHHLAGAWVLSLTFDTTCASRIIYRISSYLIRYSSPSLFIRYVYRICTFANHSRWILRSLSFVHIISPSSPRLYIFWLQPSPSLLLVHHFLSLIYPLHLHIPVIALPPASILVSFYFPTACWLGSSPFYICNIPPPLAVVPCPYISYYIRIESTYSRLYFETLYLLFSVTLIRIPINQLAWGVAMKMMNSVGRWDFWAKILGSIHAH